MIKIKVQDEHKMVMFGLEEIEMEPLLVKIKEQFGNVDDCYIEILYDGDYVVADNNLLSIIKNDGHQQTIKMRLRKKIIKDSTDQASR